VLKFFPPRKNDNGFLGPLAKSEGQFHRLDNLYFKFHETDISFLTHMGVSSFTNNNYSNLWNRGQDNPLRGFINAKQ